MLAVLGGERHSSETEDRQRHHGAVHFRPRVGGDKRERRQGEISPCGGLDHFEAEPRLLRLGATYAQETERHADILGERLMWGERGHVAEKRDDGTPAPGAAGRESETTLPNLAMHTRSPIDTSPQSSFGELSQFPWTERYFGHCQVEAAAPSVGR